MGDGKIEMFKDEWFRCGSNVKKKDDSSWMINNSPSIGESTISTCSSLVETTDDASSLSSSAGAFSDLSTLMLQLPIKRGLSEYYEGKSESFTCLGSVEEDLRKKGTPYSRKMKACKSSYTLTKPIIFKKVSRSSILSSSYTTRKGKFFYQQEQEQAFQY